MDEFSDPETIDPSETERLVLRAAHLGNWARFTGGQDQQPIGAMFLRLLIAGLRPDWRVGQEGVRIQGARITGPLNLVDVRGPGGGALPSLVFVDCEFDHPVVVSGGSFRALSFCRCSLPALSGSGLRLEADLDLTGSHFGGVERDDGINVAPRIAIDLDRARIGGRVVMASDGAARFTAQGVVCVVSAKIGSDLVMNGARLDGAGGPALNAGAIEISGDATFNMAAATRFEASGEIRFQAARIQGDLSFAGARLSNSQGRALHCEDIVVEGVFLRWEGETPFEAAGRINFLSASIGGNFVMSGGRLTPGPDYEGAISVGGPVCLNLQQARISNALILHNIGSRISDDDKVSTGNEESDRQDVKGWFLLSGSQVGSIADDPETGWPAHGYLDLDGLSYTHLRTRSGGDIATVRLKWLRRQYEKGKPRTDTFRPQPFEELARMLRMHGRAEEADHVAIEKIRMRLAAKVGEKRARYLPHLLMVLSHHGYSSSRALFSFIVFILLGTAFYAIALWGFDQPFLPVELAPVPTHYAIFSNWIVSDHDQGCPGLALPQYALDVALPVVDLGQSSLCRFAPQGGVLWIWQALHALYAIFGAALSAIVVLTFTGVLRRD